jgi:hypothetical protein
MTIVPSTVRHDDPPVAPVHQQRSAAARLLDRWPSALALVLGALIAADLTIDESSIDSIAALTVLIVLVYVGAAAVRRQAAAWPVLMLGLPVILIPFDSRSTAVVILLAATAALATYGLVRGRHGLGPQIAAAIVVTAGSVAALAAGPTAGAYLVGFALLAHAGWDLYHHRRDRVVARSYAEFCALFDVIVGAAILVAIG